MTLPDQNGPERQSFVSCDENMKTYSKRRVGSWQRQLLDDFVARRLHVKVDRANIAFGHGIARTHDFGFRPGENMCRDIPIEVRAHLRTLHIS